MVMSEVTVYANQQEAGRSKFAQIRYGLPTLVCATIRHTQPTIYTAQKPFLSYVRVIDPKLAGSSLGGVPREQKMLKGHLPRVVYHQVY